MYKFQDPELFKNDLLTALLSSGKLQPPGYVFLYRTGSHFIDPLLFSKVIPILLVIISVLYMFRLGKSLGGGEVAGFVAGMLFICDVFIIGWGKHFQAGISRSFAYPLFISFVYYFVNKKPAKASINLVLQSLFYPPIFLNSAFLWGISCMRKSWIKEIKSSAILVVGFVVAGLILVNSYTSSPTFLGTLISGSEAKTMPEFGPDGRSDFFKEHLYEYLFMGRAGLNLDKVSVYIALLIPMGFVLGKRVFRVKRTVYDIMISSLILFVIAHIVLFKLHLPSRYVLYTLPVAFNLLIAMNCEGFLEELRARYGINLLQKMPGPKMVFGFLLVAIIIILGYKVSSSATNENRVELYKFISTLPKDVLIAGYPNDMDGVPLLSKRKVLVNMELALPYYSNYYSEIRKRTFDLFTAYYSNNPSEIMVFCKKYGVDYIVVNKNHFDWKFLNEKIYYSPFGEYAKSLVEKNKSFVLNDMVDSKKVFKKGTYSVISCNKESLN
ncbi:MAG: hypothetical protein HYW01_00105 [Deltaproteobacteria bacterium]|nr:hypothetical protein [Deltaproteobacteria bacterium]